MVKTITVNTPGMPRIPYRASEGNTLNNPSCPITPPSRHHLLHQRTGPHTMPYHPTLTSASAPSKDCTIFNVLQCHLSDL